VELEATVTDPDGNQLTYKWRHYDDSIAVTISNSDSPGEAGFVVPNEPGKEIRITLELIHNGTPPTSGRGRDWILIIEDEAAARSAHDRFGRAQTHGPILELKHAIREMIDCLDVFFEPTGWPVAPKRFRMQVGWHTCSR
jgi:cellulose-binding protein